MKMRILTLTILSLIYSMSVPAQITLAGTDFPSLLTGVDTIKMTRMTTTFPPLPFSAGALWDMTGLVDSPDIFYSRRTPLMGADYAESLYGDIFGFSFRKQVCSSFEPFAIKNNYWVVADSVYSITFLTANSNDSLSIPSQTIHYTSPDIVVPLPAGYGTWWNAYYSYDAGYVLTVTLPAYDHTPGYVRRFVAKTSTAEGWGWVRMKDMDGNPGPDIPVLQVKSQTIITDSFYLDGAPMPNVLQALFSVQQGQADTIYEQNYLRRGEVTPLVNVRFKDATYTHPLWARRHVQRLLPDAVNTLRANQKQTVYPNPVTGGWVTVDGLPEGCIYTLVDVLGRAVAEGACVNNRIQVPDNACNGNYYLLLSDSKKQSVLSLTIQRP